MEFTAVTEAYLNAKISGRKPIRPNTLEGYMSAIRCHLLPKWSGREVESIASDEMQAWVDSFEKPGAARKAFFTLRQIIRWYLRTYKVRIYDETQAVEVPTKPRRKPHALTAKQAASSLRDMRGQEWEAAALVQLSCGLRPCEAIALTWADLNLKSGEVDVHAGLHEAFGNVYESETKTEKSTRTVITFETINGGQTLSLSGRMALVIGASDSQRSFVAFFYKGVASSIVNNGNVVTLGADGSGNYTIQNNLPSSGLRYIMVK